MEHSKNNRLLIAFYGDDFTGSTDALESLNNAGIKTVLFIEPPTPQQLSNYTNLQAIGVAGMSRSLSPMAMENVLRPAFKALVALNPMHVHYKVCSTFDSSPKTGSIGKAIDIGVEVFKTAIVPLLVAAPLLGRYCLFGNLFARMGIGSDGDIFRLDRHPSMSKHPITPADESDLRLHLAKQTEKKIGLFNILELQQYQKESFDVDLSAHEIVLFDALIQEDLRPIGLLIDSMSKADNIVFSVGSSGVEMALGTYWQNTGVTKTQMIWPSAKVNKAILVVSGSCSNVTAGQINYALENGFAEIAIDTISLAKEVDLHDFDQKSNFINAVQQYSLQAASLIKQGKSLIIHTSLGSNDERVHLTDQVFKEKNYDKADTAKLYGTLLGLIVKEVVTLIAIQRVIIAGGDTSSYAARAMGIEAVEMIAPLSTGAPICLAHAPESSVDQLQVIFKGGQVGKVDLFVKSEKNI